MRVSVRIKDKATGLVKEEVMELSPAMIKALADKGAKLTPELARDLESLAVWS